MVRKTWLIALLTSLLLVAGASQAFADNYKLDMSHSSIVFGIKHNKLVNFYGRFNKAEGNFKIDWKNPSKSSISFKVFTGSVDTNHPKRDKHLRGPDFFNALQNPVSTFVSTTVKKVKGNVFEATGKFTLNKVTKVITIQFALTGPITDPWKQVKIGFTTNFSIKRSDYKITYGLKKGGLGDKVSFTIAIEATKTKVAAKTK